MQNISENKKAKHRRYMYLIPPSELTDDTFRRFVNRSGKTRPYIYTLWCALAILLWKQSLQAINHADKCWLCGGLWTDASIALLPHGTGGLYIYIKTCVDWFNIQLLHYPLVFKISHGATRVRTCDIFALA